MTDRKMIMVCRHCGIKATFEVCGWYNQDFSAETPEGEQVFIDVTTWQLLKCTKCSGPTLLQSRYTRDCDGSFFNEEDFPREGKTVEAVLYPLVTRVLNFNPFAAPLPRLPDEIENECLSAIKYKYSDPISCAMYIGRALEAICKYEGVEGKTLHERLGNLVNSDRIPKTLAEMTRQLRLIRNRAAHLDDAKVTRWDTNSGLDFLEAVIEYLYIIPAKIAEVEARLKKTP